MSALVAGVAQHEVHVGRRPEAVAEQFDAENVALLGGEGVPVAVAAASRCGRRSRTAASPPAPSRACRSASLSSDHRGAGEGEQERVGRAGVVATRYSKPSSAGRRRRDVAAEGQPLRACGSAGGGDGDGELLQRAAVDDRRRVGLAAGQVAAVDRHLRRLARLDHGREDGVDPRGGGDGQAVEVLGRAQGVRELEEADVVIAVVGQGRSRPGRRCRGSCGWRRAACPWRRTAPAAAAAGCRCSRPGS